MMEPRENSESIFFTSDRSKHWGDNHLLGRFFFKTATLNNFKADFESCLSSFVAGVHWQVLASNDWNKGLQNERHDVFLGLVLQVLDNNLHGLSSNEIVISNHLEHSQVNLLSSQFVLNFPQIGLESFQAHLIDDELSVAMSFVVD